MKFAGQQCAKRAMTRDSRFRDRPKRSCFRSELTCTGSCRLPQVSTSTPYGGCPKSVFAELHDDANRSLHGGGRLFRNYVAQFMALPSGSKQLCVVEIQLTKPVYAWVGHSAALFGRPGGMDQVYLPNLAERGNPRMSGDASLVRTYWLKF
jgi:hypothetical protein